MDTLTTREAAALLRYKDPRTLYKKIQAGVFRYGVHYYKPERGQFRWIREGLLAYLRGEVQRERPVVRVAGGTKKWA